MQYSKDTLVGINISDSWYLAYESKPNKMGEDREQTKGVYLPNHF